MMVLRADRVHGRQRPLPARCLQVAGPDGAAGGPYERATERATGAARHTERATLRIEFPRGPLRLYLERAPGTMWPHGTRQSEL